MAAAAQFREQLNGLDPDRPKVSFDVMIARACAVALQKFPAVYSQSTEEGIVQPDGIHLQHANAALLCERDEIPRPRIMAGAVDVNLPHRTGILTQPAHHRVKAMDESFLAHDAR